MLVLPVFIDYSEYGRDSFLFHISSIFSSISNEWTSATSRKISGSYSEISVPYSQITKGYWRTIWHWLVTLRAERRSAPWCVVDSREVSSRQQGAEWLSAGKVSAVRMFIFSFATTEIVLTYSISDIYTNTCPYFAPTLPLLSPYRPPTNSLFFSYFTTTSRVSYYRLASFYIQVISKIL